MDELHLQEPAHDPQESDLCSSKMEPSLSTEETHAKHFEIPSCSKEVFFVGEKKWFDILPVKFSEDTTLKTNSQNWS